MKCVNCGTENPEGAKFCIKCGTKLNEPDAATAPPTPSSGVAKPPKPPQAPHAPEAAYSPPGAAGAPTPSGQTPAYGMPPLAYTPPPPAAGMPVGPRPGAPMASGAPMAPGYPTAVAKKHTLLYLGSVLALLGGIIVVVSTWLPWAGSFGFNSTGWDGYSGAGNFGQRFVQVVDGKPAFTALPMVIAGGLIILMALLMLLVRKKGLGMITLILALGTVAMGVLTMITFKTFDTGFMSASVNLQYGLYLLGAFGLVAAAGSIVALTD